MKRTSSLSVVLPLKSQVDQEAPKEVKTSTNFARCAYGTHGVLKDAEAVEDFTNVVAFYEAAMDALNPSTVPPRHMSTRCWTLR